MRLLLITFLTLCCVGCGGLKEWRYLPESQYDERVIYVVSHGWHTGVVVLGKSLEAELGFLSQDFGRSEYYEIGWGEKGFYQAKKITSGLTVKAIFWPTDSVMHIVSLPVAPQDYFIDSDVIEVRMSNKGLENLIASVSGSFKRDSTGSVIKTKSGLYGQSIFYEAVGKFYVTNNCNTWVARALYSAGVPIRTIPTLTAGSIVNQVEDAVREYQCCP